MENQMDIQILSVEPNCGLRKHQGRLVIVPEDEGYVVRLLLKDGRAAYLAGSGAPPQAELATR
jgi:hypothetical protein